MIERWENYTETKRWKLMILCVFEILGNEGITPHKGDVSTQQDFKEGSHISNNSTFGVGRRAGRPAWNLPHK